MGKFEIGKTLGEGTFGKVKFAVNPETGEKVAIKILDKEKIQKQNMGQQVKKEVRCIGARASHHQRASFRPPPCHLLPPFRRSPS